MGPKKVAPPVAPAATTAAVGSKSNVVSDTGISVAVQITKSGADTYKGIHVRLIGHIIDCSSSQTFGEQVPWAPYKPKSSIEGQGGNPTSAATAGGEGSSEDPLKPKIASYTFPNIDITTTLKDAEKAKTFHAKPGLYAVLMGKRIEGGEDIDIPISFAYVDCSYFLYESGKMSGRSQSVSGLLFEFTVTASKPLMEKAHCMSFEPMIINLEKLGGYPVLQNELEGDALDPVYICGTMDLGSFSRSVFARPLTLLQVTGDAAASPTASNADPSGSAGDSSDAAASGATPESNVININQKLCFLPGMADLGKFKECLTSATFVLQVHREDLHKRAFSAKNIDELKIVRQQAAPVGGAKPVPGAALKGPDLYLVQCIDAAIASASQSNPHGTARFRLEDLLSSSVDLLKEFALRHAGHDRPDTDTDTDTDTVVVREDMLIEVRLCKPSKPPKVAKPSDVSLRSALIRARDSERAVTAVPSSGTATPRGTASAGVGAGVGTAMSTGVGAGEGVPRKSAGLGDTLAGTVMGRGVVVPSGITHKARHEQFFECGTRLALSAELHRSLTHPTDPPKTLPDELFKIREQRQFADHYAMLANRTEAAIGFTTTMLPPRPGYGTSLVNEELLNASMASTVSLHPTKMQLLGSSLGLAFESLNFDLFMSDELQARLAVTPFTRMVIVFRYDDDDTLLLLSQAIAKVNRKALPDIQGSLRSYALDESQLEACSSGELDLVTGVMVIDDDSRTLVLEGLAMPGGGMQSIFMDVPRPKENDHNFKMLCNPEILFPDRLYPSFGPELKRIRLRDKLNKLTRRPELYNRKQVEDVCFESFDMLMTLRRAQDLKCTKDLRMYPSSASLNSLELLYGEAVSRADLDGLAAEAQRVAMLEQKRLEKLARLRGEDPASIHLPEASLSLGTEGLGMSGAGSTRPQRHKSGPSDCRNLAFEMHLHTRPQHRVDHLEDNRELRRQAWVNMLNRRDQRENDYAETMERVLGKEGAQGGKLYLYSTQTENFKVKAMREMRQRLGQVKNTTFTFSKDFVSQTLCLVDEDADRKALVEQSKREMLTDKGFRYPAAKTRQDLITHPKRPPEVIIDDLKEPWTGDMPLPTAPGESLQETARNLLLEKGYTTRVSQSGAPFGGLKAPEFSRMFELKLVGDRIHLPRGVLVGGTRHETDPAFFKSVHLGGEKQAQIVAAAMAKEKENWAAKVVVDDTSFKVGHFNVRDRPMQLDRTKDILHDEPHRTDLKTLRHKTSQSTGKLISYEPAPLAMFSTGAFVQNEGIINLLRKEDRTKFMTTQDLTKTGKLTGPVTRDMVDLKDVDFRRYIHKNANATSKLVQAVSTRRHPPLDRGSAECSGPRWVAPTVPSFPPIH